MDLALLFRRALPWRGLGALDSRTSKLFPHHLRKALSAGGRGVGTKGRAHFQKTNQKPRLSGRLGGSPCRGRVTKQDTLGLTSWSAVSSLGVSRSLS